MCESIAASERSANRRALRGGEPGEGTLRTLGLAVSPPHPPAIAAKAPLGGRPLPASGETVGSEQQSRRNRTRSSLPIS